MESGYLDTAKIHNRDRWIYILQPTTHQIFVKGRTIMRHAHRWQHMRRRSLIRTKQGAFFCHLSEVYQPIFDAGRYCGVFVYMHHLR